MKRLAHTATLTPRLHVLLDIGPVAHPAGPRLGESMADLQAAYWAHRDWLIDPQRNRPGRRPWCWWKFECAVPEMLDASEAERLDFLRKHKLLRPDEVAALDRANGGAA